MKRLILLGGGGHCRSCIDVIELAGTYCIAGILDTPEMVGEKILGYPVIGTDDMLPDLVEDADFLVTVGQIKTAEVRIRLLNLVCEYGGHLATVCSPRAYVSCHARIGAGTIVMHDALVNAGAVIGRNCIVNTKALVEHDVVIGDHCHISTGVRVNGGVSVADGVFIGSGSVCREMVRIPGGTVVGGHSFVSN